MRRPKGLHRPPLAAWRRSAQAAVKHRNKRVRTQAERVLVLSDCLDEALTEAKLLRKLPEPGVRKSYVDVPLPGLE